MTADIKLKQILDVIPDYYTLALDGKEVTNAMKDVWKPEILEATVTNLSAYTIDYGDEIVMSIKTDYEWKDYDKKRIESLYQ